MILLDGPLEGTRVKHPPAGRCLVYPEYQRCDRQFCHLHWISHEYGWDGRWLRSYSFLDSYLELEDGHSFDWPAVFS